MKAKYQVRIFQEDNCNYFIAMQTTDKDLAISKMNKLNSEGHTAHVNVVDTEVPEHLNHLSEDNIKNLRHMFKEKF